MLDCGGVGHGLGGCCGGATEAVANTAQVPADKGARISTAARQSVPCISMIVAKMVNPAREPRALHSAASMNLLGRAMQVEMYKAVEAPDRKTRKVLVTESKKSTSGNQGWDTCSASVGVGREPVVRGNQSRGNLGWEVE